MLVVGFCSGRAPKPKPVVIPTAPTTADVDGEDDADGDGWSADVDCNDASKAISPSTPEICGNAIDEDCDGVVEKCGMAWETWTVLVLLPLVILVAGYQYRDEIRRFIRHTAFDAVVTLLRRWARRLRS